MPQQLCCMSPKPVMGALWAGLRPRKHLQLSKKPGLGASCLSGMAAPQQGQGANPGGAAQMLAIAPLRCSFLYHSRSYFMYLFTVSNSSAFLPKGFCCTASKLTLQLRPWAFVKISWKQTSPWLLTLGGVRIWVYSALLASLYHQPNQNLGSSSP